MYKKLRVGIFALLSGLLMATVLFGKVGSESIRVTIREIDMSPRMLSEQCPEIFPVGSLEQKAVNPKWTRVYRYAISSQDDSNFNKEDHLQAYPNDAVFIGESSVNMFVIFSDSLPNKKRFYW